MFLIVKVLIICLLLSCDSKKNTALNNSIFHKVDFKSFRNLFFHKKYKFVFRAKLFPYDKNHIIVADRHSGVLYFYNISTNNIIRKIHLMNEKELEGINASINFKFCQYSKDKIIFYFRNKLYSFDLIKEEKSFLIEESWFKKRI